ncbi:MAG: hypothetical protein HKN91_05150 [Acidimicrobiia bacterium]|nr:hypothetical protein [Acidimicrobiia bacterium]
MTGPESADVDADALVAAEYERQITELKHKHDAAAARGERRKLRRKIRRLRRHYFGRRIARW